MATYRIRVSHPITTTYTQTLDIEAKSAEEAEKLAEEGCGSPVDHEIPMSQFGEELPQIALDYEIETEVLAIEGIPTHVDDDAEEEH